MKLGIILLCLLLAGVTFSLFVFVTDVQAIVPEIQEVVYWTSGNDVMVNVTFYHNPVTAFHYANQIEVDIGGIVSSYDVSQSSVTSTVQINLGEISGNPDARVRMHCTVDGWSGWSETQTIGIPGNTSPTPYEESQQIGQELILGIVVAVAVVSIALLVYIIRRK